MTLLSDVVESVFPSDQSVGVTLTDTIRITFNRAMDEACLAETIIVEGPDTDQVIHNSYLTETLVEGAEATILNSPGYMGIVPGDYTFERLDPTTGLPVTTEDPTGLGTLYKTRVTFTPHQPFAPDTEYVVHIVGDEDLTDDEDFGTKNRSVFDGVADGGNTSTGLPLVEGTYTGGLSSDTVNVRVTASGILATAEFEWWLDSSPLTLYGPALTHINALNFIEGTTIRFEEGTYIPEDTWTFVLKDPEFFEGTQTFAFTTGGGNITPVAETTSTSPTGIPIPTALIATTAFDVVSTSPDHLATNQPVTAYDRICIQFSSDIDPATITDETVSVTAEPVINHPNLTIQSPDGPIAKILTVSGNKLFIDV